MAKKTRPALIMIDQDAPVAPFIELVSNIRKSKTNIGLVFGAIILDDEDPFGLRIGSMNKEVDGGLDMGKVSILIPWRYIHGIIESEQFLSIEDSRQKLTKAIGFIPAKKKST